jgi:hypothetical protein
VTLLELPYYPANRNTRNSAPALSASEEVMIGALTQKKLFSS